MGRRVDPVGETRGGTRSWDALRADPDHVHEACEGLNPVWRAELARLLPELGAPEPSAASTDAGRLFEAITQLTGRLAAPQPLLLALEDLHWADEMTARLLAFLGRRIEAWPVLVVATAREEELADAPLLGTSLDELRQHARLVDLALRPLSRVDIGTLVRSTAAASLQTVELDRLEDHVWTLSEGNPFVALETVRAADERAASGDPRTRPLPRRVRELVATRLERLSERSRHLVAVASVIGREFDFALLQRGAGLGDREAAEAVEELVRRRVFHGIGERLDFAHDRIREVARDQILPAQRRVLHRLAARAIEEVYASDLDPYCTALATHYREGEVWDKAVACFRQAGVQATARSAFRQAVEFFEQALAALSRLPDTRETRALAIDLRFDLRSPLYQLNEFAQATGRIREAETLARTLDDQRRLGRVSVYLAAAFWVAADWPQTRRYSENAEAVAAATADDRLQVHANYYLGLAGLSVGDLRTGEEHLRTMLRRLDGGLSHDLCGMAASPAVLARSWLAWSLAERGAFEDGIACGEEGTRIAEALDDPYSKVHVYRNLAWLYVVKGDLGQALHLLERGAVVCRDWNVVFLAPVVTRGLGYLHALSGRAAEAIALLHEAHATIEAVGILAHESLTLAQLGDAYALAGRLEEAHALAERALMRARERGERGYEAFALRVLGEIASRRDPPGGGAAEHAYHQALSLATDLGMRPLVAHCHLGLGGLYQRLGKRLQAEEHSTAATTMGREMDMRFCLDRVEGGG